MLRKIAGLAPAFVLSATVAACGGEDGPNVNQVRQDFANPSGSVNDKAALMDATGNRNSSNAALALAGGGVPGQSLTSVDARAFSLISPSRIHGRQIDAFSRFFASHGRSMQSLSTAQFSGDVSASCDEAGEAAAAYTAALEDFQRDALTGGSSASGSASYSLDVGSCSGGALTGTLEGSLEISAEADGNGGSFVIRVTQKLNHVCEVGGAQACLDGSMVYEAAGTGNQAGGSFDSIAAWQLTASWTEDGAPMSVETKGGIKWSASGTQTGGTFKVEYLLYAKSSAGEEVSFVLEIEATGGEDGGSVTWRYRGADGEASCTISSDGAGECTGPAGTVTWSSSEYEAEFAKK